MIKPVLGRETFIDLTVEAEKEEHDIKTEQILEKAEEVGLKIHQSEEKFLGACTITWEVPETGKKGIISVPEEMLPEFLDSLSTQQRLYLIEYPEAGFFLDIGADHGGLGCVIMVNIHNKAVNLDEFNLHFGELYLRDILDALKEENQ